VELVQLATLVELVLLDRVALEQLVILVELALLESLDSLVAQVLQG
jgi:hypothetical protein